MTAAVTAVSLLGSTGSVGTQAVDLITAHPERFRVVALGAGGANIPALVAQAVALRPQVVAIADARQYAAFTDQYAAAASAAGPDAVAPQIVVGDTAMADAAAVPADVVLNAVTGSVGLAATLAALRAGTTLALANKESLVAGGPLVKAALQRPDQIVPVDSEHSAIAQALRGGSRAEVARLILTASGGPFRGRARADLAAVTYEQALAHPTWSMGPVVTINSATMVNKALELIEAHLLFDVPAELIEVVVHPQSAVHSMVEFVDGATIAQASPPDMHLPIALGLTWPERLPGATATFDWRAGATWTFEPLDDDAFPAVALARAALASGPLHAAAFNAANEEAVAAFRGGLVGFLDIVDTIAAVLTRADAALGSQPPGDVADVVAAEGWARSQAQELLRARH